MPTATFGFMANVMPFRTAGAAALRFTIAATDFVDVHALHHLAVTLFHKVLLTTFNSGHFTLLKGSTAKNHFARRP